MSFWLVFLLACLPHFTAGNHNRVRYESLGSKTYSGRGCTSFWCGEKWRAQRILYYNLTATSKLIRDNQTTLVTTHDCKGTQHSSECEQTGSDQTSQVTTTRVVVVSRTSDEPIVLRESPELDHKFILSDNMEFEEGTTKATSLKQTSPNYPANLTKIWQYKIPKCCKMHVRFLNFSIENTPNCKNDYFSVQTSKDKDEVLVFCDKMEWIEIKYRKRVQFTLHSDYAVNNGQVAAKVTLSKINPDNPDPNCDCETVSRRRRRRRESNQTLESLDQEGVRQNAMNQRLAALQRLRNTRLRQQS